ncbi:MAG: tRNA 2-thiouridine(34) synthase MnmA [Dethiobacter sp.]|jgi:tRNA-specific 2-thiouridylase|nr:tRNA 2-thiouridine(34) synthase MnmA [Dethiobacter sp.]
MNHSKNNRVLVAMSGGVDSSLAAALLQEQGFEVIGVTMRLWVSPDFEEEAHHSGRGCCSLAAVDDARRVAEKLGIPYYVLNFRDAFREKVVDYFINEYKRGRTPNPCIACNRYLKFDMLLRKAFELDAWYVATGHYAQVEHDGKSGRWRLKKSADPEKDQTYTLYNLTQEQLAHILFPLGGYKKTEVREMASRLELAVAAKPDSQEICFIPDDDYKKFLSGNSDIEDKPGSIYDTDGKKLGAHRGLAYYTVGQRKGLGLAAGRPLYVVELDVSRNALIVGDDKEVYSDGLLAGDINYILVENPETTMRINARVRYHAREAPAVLTPLPGGRVRVDFEEPERAVTPGQSVVFYHGDDVLGGGIIEKSLRAGKREVNYIEG